MNSNAYYGNNIPNNPIYNGNIVKESLERVTPSYDLPMDQSYIENILRLNKGKEVKIYMSFPGSNENRDKEYSGIIENSGRDYIILSEPSTGKWQMLPIMYVNYITFDEKINYS